MIPGMGDEHICHRLLFTSAQAGAVKMSMIFWNIFVNRVIPRGYLHILRLPDGYRKNSDGGQTPCQMTFMRLPGADLTRPTQ